VPLKNEPTKPSRLASSNKPGATPERARHLLDDLKKMAKAGQVKLAPGNTVRTRGTQVVPFMESSRGVKVLNPPDISR
jgi:hypothetical protein